MKKLLLGLLLVIGVAVSGVEAKADTYYGNFKITQEVVWASVDAEYRYDEAYELLKLVNKYREDNGVPVLQTNDTLMKIAMQRALECNILLEHTTPYGNNPTAAVDVLGYIPTNPTFNEAVKFSFNENIYGAGFKADASDALGWWKNSKGHNDSILNQNDHAGEKQYAIGVGFVNDCAVVCFFSKESAKTAANNTKLSNYSKTELVPVCKSYVEDGSVDTSDKRVKYNVDPTTGDSTEDTTEESTIETQKKAVKATKTTLKSVKAKRSGRNNTRVTVKFSKKKGMKYQVQYAFNKKFTKGKKTFTVSSGKKTFTIKKKNNKCVYVRVRCMKKLDGKWVKGKWSSIATTRTVKKR